MNKEYIICAAIWINNETQYVHQPNNISSGYVVCGQRHHNCFMTVSIIRGEDIKKSDYGHVIQGFLTSDNRFLNRKEAGELAFNAGQIETETDCLFSEDLY